MSAFGLSFAKEAVAGPTITRTHSLLASTLASGSTTSPIATSMPLADGGESPPTSFLSPIPPGFAVSSAIRALVTALASRYQGVLPAVPHPSGGIAIPATPLPHATLVDPARYDVRVADDDGTVDGDFPPVDLASNLVSVGASIFLLCDGATDIPLLRFRIRLEAPEIPSAPAPLLLYVEWHATTSSTRVAPFPVLLQPALVGHHHLPADAAAVDAVVGSPTRPSATVASFHPSTFYSGAASESRTPASRTSRKSSSSVASSNMGEAPSGMEDL